VNHVKKASVQPHGRGLDIDVTLANASFDVPARIDRSLSEIGNSELAPGFSRHGDRISRIEYNAPATRLPLHAMGQRPIHALPDSVTELPVMALADDIAEALSTRDVLLRAEPGAGKSTGLPLALLSSDTLAGQILLLEPRRLAARSVAARLAAHLGEKIGQRIGLRMRADTRVSRHTRLTVVTEGVLTRILQDDPELTGIALVIFDEFHERSLHADVGLALTLEVQQALRRDLRLLLMSATLDAAPLSERLQDVARFQCAVRQNTVEILWTGESSGALDVRVQNTVLNALDRHAGDILVFLPGVAEITRCARLLRPRLPVAVDVHVLHGGVGAAEQRGATAPAVPARRRVILSTSLAETSITIDGVRIVVDSGLERRGTIDTGTGGQRLETVMASQASATQRAGRAGRTSPGVCYRLWSESGHARRVAHWQAEIHRADLAPLVLELGLWGAAGADDLAWLEPPPPASIARAQGLLTRLGLWCEGRLTSAGRTVAALPVHPRLGSMLVWGADHGAGRLACRIAAVLDDQTRGTSSVDLEPLLNGTPTSTQDRRARQLERLLGRGDTRGRSMPAAVLLARAYPDWIARRRLGDTPTYRLACGTGVVMSADDALAHAPWLVVAELGGAGRQLRIFKALALDIDELQRHSPEYVHAVKHIDWDDKRQRVVAEHRRMLGHLVIDARPVHDIPNDDRATSLLAGIRRLGLACLPWDATCREWQARVTLMSTLSIDGQEPAWPAVDDDALMASLDEWLLPWLSGVGSIKALRQLNLHQALNAMLDYRQQQRLDEWLPTRYTVPSGSRIALSYLQSGAPVLSVRLQEMLGCAENPAVAKGRIPLKVELLSPAHRPVQVTTDLKNFWTNSYPAVKKDMAGRYPKHVWPDDPANARPTTRTRRTYRPHGTERNKE